MFCINSTLIILEAFVICFMKCRFNSAIITHFEAKCLGTIHIWHPLKFSNFQNPHLPVHLRPKFFHPLDLGCPISNNSTPPFHPPASPANYGTTTAPCTWTNEIKTEAKPSQVTFKLTTHHIVRFSPQTMQWHHQSVDSLSDTTVNRKSSCK